MNAPGRPAARRRDCGLHPDPEHGGADSGHVSARSPTRWARGLDRANEAVVVAESVPAMLVDA